MGLGTQLVLAVTMTRDMWFEGDGIHYLTERGPVPEADRGLIEPWGGHWQTTVILIYRLMFQIFGLKHYLPYLLISTTLHIAICVLLFTLLRRFEVSPWIAVGVVWVVVFFGGGAEAYIFDAPIPLTLALMMGLAAVAIISVESLSRRRALAATLVLGLAVMTSGVGLVAVLVVSVFVWCEHGWRSALRIIAFPSVLFLVWFVLVGHDSGRIRLEGAEYLTVPEFMFTNLTTALGNAVGIPGTGGALLLVLVVGAFVVRGIDPRLQHLAWACLVGMAAAVTLSALASTTFGIGAAAASRYQYLVVVLIAPAAGLVVQGTVQRLRAHEVGVPNAGRPALALVLLGLFFAASVTANGLALQKKEVDTREAFAAVFKRWAVGTVAATNAGGRVLTPTPDAPFFGTGVDVRLMTTPEIRAALPDDPVPAQDVLDTESEVFVGVGPKEFDVAPPARSELIGFDREVLRSGPGCHEYQATSFTPELVISGPDGAEIGVRSASTTIATFLTDGDRVGLTREWRPGQQDVFIATSVRDSELHVRFDAGGTYIICAGS